MAVTEGSRIVVKRMRDWPRNVVSHRVEAEERSRIGTPSASFAHLSNHGALVDSRLSARHTVPSFAMRARFVGVVALCVAPVVTRAQAAGFGPIVLQLPASARAIGFGGAY